MKCAYCTKACGNSWCPYAADGVLESFDEALRVLRSMESKPGSKSHALDILEGILVESKSYEDPRDVARRLLTAMEALGMQPPRIKVAFDLRKPDGTMQKSVSYVNRWKV